MKTVWCIAAFVLAIILMCKCKGDESKKNTDKSMQDGQLLAEAHCKSCHVLPDPLLLDKTTWANHILPKMGELVGFRYLGFNHYTENGNPSPLKLSEWNKIVQYYITQSPPKLAAGTAKRMLTGLKQFDIQIPGFGLLRPSTTMVNASSSLKGFYFGDGLSQQVYFLSYNSEVVDSFPVSKGISNLVVTDSSLLALNMGVLQPSDEKSGKLLSVNRFNKKKKIVLDSLQRPVYAEYANLNNDQFGDIIVCEFGNLTGRLGWFESKGNDRYIGHLLRPLPGAIKTAVYDFNKDGSPDILALMAQGNEGFFIYYNKGNNEFTEENIMQFPPSYGSNYFELRDINADGHPDIIATNGDNGDYPPILKPYHGIRIYLNDGKQRFAEKVFLPMNGVGKAIGKDFDGDGDIDIASISYFPDYTIDPGEGFIYWENKGNFKYEPSSFSDVNKGRWLTMDAGDIDGDGDEDIVLGNANFSIGDVPAGIKKSLDAYSPSVIILKNKSQH